MRVKCRANTGKDLPASCLDDAVGFRRATEFQLLLDKDYVVYGLTVRKGHLWFYVVDEGGRDYPVYHPGPLFEVVDGRISKWWVLGYRSTRVNEQVLVSFSEWASEPWNYYDRLSDGDPAAVATFRRYRELMDLEFDDEGVESFAASLDATWLQCPRCQASWRDDNETALLRCPQCRTVLRRPRTAGVER